MMHRSLLRKVLTHALIIALCVVILLPLYVAITTSLKQPSMSLPVRINGFPIQSTGRIIKTRQLCSLGTLFTEQCGAKHDGDHDGDVLVGTCRLCFFLYRVSRQAPLFLLILATLMVSGEVTIIPNFLTIQRLGWVDTYWD